MSDAWVGVAGTGIGAFLGFAGSALSDRRAAKRATAAWYRDRREQVLTAAIEMIAAVPDPATAPENFRTWQTASAQAHFGLRLHCSPATAAAYLSARLSIEQVATNKTLPHDVLSDMAAVCAKYVMSLARIELGTAEPDETREAARAEYDQAAVRYGGTPRQK